MVAGSQERARAHARSHCRDGTNRALRERATMAPSRNRNRHDYSDGRGALFFSIGFAEIERLMRPGSCFLRITREDRCLTTR
jgi:hypothetical protein